MMQRLLTLVLLALAGSLSAQDLIWEEDFSRGFQGWSANPLICGSNAGATYGNISGTDFGVWNLQSGTVDGTAIDYAGLGVSAQWTFINSSEYQFILDSDAGSVYATVYGSYSIDDNDVMTSSVDPDVMLSGLEFSEATAGGLVEWATVAELPAGDVTDLVKLHIGVGSPTVVLTDGGNTLTYTIADGGSEYVFTYTKSSECGTLWVWSPNGNLGSGAFGFEAPGAAFVDSDTRTNGTMVMRNIFYMFEGDAANIPAPNPPPYPHYASELISPPIDISAADRALSLSLTEFFAYLNTPTEAPDGLKTSFAVSSDDGATWSPAVDLNPNFPTNTFRDATVTVPIPAVYTDGADEIRIKITFATDYYFIGIDDISIQERIGYDVQANENFFAIPDNVNTPWSQLQPQFFMADVQNNGGLTADNVQLNLTINKDDTGEEVYNMTKNYGNLGPDSLAENDFFDTTMPLDLPSDPSSLGTYSGQYTIFHDSMDVITNNDTLNFAFEVTDSLFAKETGRTREIFLTNDRSWYIGNSYYVPNGENWYARWISFMVGNASDVVAGGGLTSITTFIYESDGDLNDDGRIDPGEYDEVPFAFNEYEFDGSEDEVLITIPASLNEEGIEMQSGKYYFVVVQYAGADEADQLAISASEDYNYNANNFITDSVGVEQYSDVVDLTSEAPSFFSGGFSGTSVPVVRLHIGDNPFLDQPAITETLTVLPDSYEVDVFPNPADTDFNLGLDFPDAQDVMIRFYDQTGRILVQQEFDGIQQARYNYSVSTLPSGIYFIQLDTQAGTRIEKVVVQH